MITEKIKKIFFEVKNNLNENMKKYNLTATQILILGYLNEKRGDTIIQKDLCDYLSLKHSTVISILRRLEIKGLIIKKTNYKSEIEITEKGVELVKLVGVQKGFVEYKLLEGFNEKEIKQLNDFLYRIYSNIN